MAFENYYIGRKDIYHKIFYEHGSILATLSHTLIILKFAKSSSLSDVLGE
jgi:hypothetical protein